MTREELIKSVDKIIEKDTLGAYAQNKKWNNNLATVIVDMMVNNYLLNIDYLGKDGGGWDKQET